MSDERRSGEPPGGAEVDAERLALLLEGRLDAAERAELLARLDRSPELLAIHADAAAALHALEGAHGTDADSDADADADADAKVVPLRAPRRRWAGLPPSSWLAAAALLVVVAGSTMVARARDAARLPDAAQLVAALGPSPADAAPLPGDVAWSRRRGAADLLDPRARAVRVGARLTALELLAGSGDTTYARVASEIAVLVGDVPGGGAAAQRFRRIADAGVMPAASELRAAAEAAEQVAGARATRVGAWLQAARVAAARRDAAFFGSAPSRAGVEGTLSLAAGVPEAGEAAADLERAVADLPASWDALAAALDRLLVALGD